MHDRPERRGGDREVRRGPRRAVVTTKVWNSDHGYDATLAAFDASLKRLGLDHVDLFLIHWPVPSADRYVEKHRRTPAQVILRWHLQIGNVVIPKSVTPSRIAENLDVFGFALDASDIATIEAMDKGARIGPDPDVFDRGA